MNTEIILFSQQLLANPRFSVGLVDYGWETVGTWTSSEGKITKVSGDIGRLYQEDVCMGGAEYKLKFTVTDMTAGSFTVRNSTTGTVHQTVSANGNYTVTFNADNKDLYFMIASTFNGSIQNCSLIATPEQWTLDLTADVPMPFNFSLDDISDLSKRKTTWSKTVTIPGTHNNNKALRQVYKIESDALFDPRKKARVIILSGGVQMLDGHMSVDGVNMFEGGAHTYDCQFIGRIANIMSRFGTLTIKDLDFSNYDHEFSLDNIKWNWGLLSNPGLGVDLGYTHCFDTNNPSGASNTPGLQLQTVLANHTGVGALQQNAYNGQSHVGIRFNSAHPFAVGNEIQISSDNDLLSGTHTVLEVPAADEITISMSWFQLTSTTCSPATGVDKIQWKGIGYVYPMIDQGCYMKEITSGALEQGAIYHCLDKKLMDDFSNLSTNVHTGGSITVADGVVFRADDGMSAPGAAIGPTNWSSGTRLLVHALPEDGGTLYSKDYSMNNWYASDLLPHIFVWEIWQKMMGVIGYEYESDVIDSSTFKKIIMNCDPGFNVVASEGQWVRLNEWLPGMTLADFFKSIIAMFNMLVIEDPEIPNKITLKCRNTFHDDSEDQTWHMAANQPLKIQLAGSLLPKSVHLKYADGTDFYNKDYNKDWGDVSNTNGLGHEVDRRYGDYFTSTGNEFSDKREVVQIKFSPTVMVGPLTQSPGGIYLDSDKNLSVTYSADENGQNLTRNKDHRILFIGIRGSNYDMSITSQRVTFGTGALNTFAGMGHVQFLGAWHVDNYTDAGAPQHDLNFGPLLAQYFGDQEYDQNDWEDNSIYGRYWQRYLTDTLDKSTKRITGTFKLSRTDIAKLDFKNFIRPYGTPYTLKLQKIMDYDVNGDGVCQCEFLTKNQ